jgi:hypothetical protein
MKRRNVADAIIRWGLGLQLLFLVFLDWGTVAFMQRSGDVSAVHVVGIGVVNVLLVGATVAVWAWMRACQRDEQRPLPTAVARRCEFSRSSSR